MLVFEVTPYIWVGYAVVCSEVDRNLYRIWNALEQV